MVCPLLFFVDVGDDLVRESWSLLVVTPISLPNIDQSISGVLAVNRSGLSFASVYPFCCQSILQIPSVGIEGLLLTS